MPHHKRPYAWCELILDWWVLIGLLNNGAWISNGLSFDHTLPISPSCQLAMSLLQGLCVCCVHVCMRACVREMKEKESGVCETMHGLVLLTLKFMWLLSALLKQPLLSYAKSPRRCVCSLEPSKVLAPRSKSAHAPSNLLISLYPPMIQLDGVTLFTFANFFM